MKPLVVWSTGVMFACFSFDFVLRPFGISLSDVPKTNGVLAIMCFVLATYFISWEEKKDEPR